jgi:outer membrane lipopolysaccharide assembly protein LptE/RlpB
MMKKIKPVWLMIGCLVGFLSACAYRFAGSGESLPEFDRLFIELLDNRTGESGIERLVTDDLKSEFIQTYGGTLTGGADAAAILSGKVTGLRSWTVSRRGALTSLERRIQLEVDVSLKRKTGEIFRSASGVSATETYAVLAGDQTATEANRQAAIASLSRQIAEAVFHRLTEDF